MKKDTKKIALVEVGEYNQTVFVDTVDNKAYKINDALEPGEEIEDFKFIRWARPMDF